MAVPFAKAEVLAKLFDEIDIFGRPAKRAYPWP